MDLELKQQLQHFLRAHTTLTLATLGKDGSPWAVSLFYAEQSDLSLIFASESRVRHSENIETEPRVSATIASDHQGWQDITGLQLTGSCQQLSLEQGALAWQVYTEKFPFVMENEPLSNRLQSGNFYRITPSWLRLIDNGRGFGFKQEFTP